MEPVIALLLRCSREPSTGRKTRAQCITSPQLRLAGVVRRASLALAYATVIAAVAANFGRTNDLLDVLSHFALIITLLATITVAAAPLLKSWRIAAVGAVGVLASSSLLVPELLAGQAQPQAIPAGEQVKLVQLNAWKNNVDVEGTAAWLLRENPDIITVEEVTGDVSRLGRLLAPRYHLPPKCVHLHACGSLVLSRWPVTEGDQIGTAPLWISATYSTVAHPHGAFSVVAMHATWPWPPGLQRQQFEALAQAVDRFPPSTTLLAGDFNAAPWSGALRRADRLLGLSRRSHGVATWPARGWPTPPFLAIDQIYAGSDWRSISLRKGPRLGSDHYPLVAVFTRAVPRESY